MSWRKRDGERENRPGAFRPEAWWTGELVYCPIKVCSAFSVRSTLTHRAEGSNNTTKRRKLRSGISSAGSEGLISFSAPVREKKVEKR